MLANSLEGLFTLPNSAGSTVRRVDSAVSLGAYGALLSETSTWSIASESERHWLWSDATPHLNSDWSGLLDRGLWTFRRTTRKYATTFPPSSSP